MGQSIGRALIVSTDFYTTDCKANEVCAKKMGEKFKKTTPMQIISCVDVNLLQLVLLAVGVFPRAKISLTTCSIITFHGCKINAVSVRGLSVG